MRLLTLTVFSTSLIFSSAIFAQTFNYTFAEIGYSEYTVDVGPGDIDADGLSIGGSFALNQDFHGFGSYTEAEVDNINVDIENWELGLGFHTSMTETIDLVLAGAVVNQEFGIPGFGSADDEGYSLGAGFRIWVAEGVELDLGLDFVDLDEAGNNTALDAGLLFSLTENIVLNVSGSWSDDPEISTLGVGARMYFGR